MTKNVSDIMKKISTPFPKSYPAAKLDAECGSE